MNERLAVRGVKPAQPASHKTIFGQNMNHFLLKDWETPAMPV